jgi:tetratricopeptide (TPR) repeat protein
MRETIALDARLFAEPTVDTATIHGNLGWALAEAGDGNAALAALDRAEALMARAGGGNAGYANSRRGYRANACLQAGRAEEALAIVDAMLAEGTAATPRFRPICLRIRIGALRRLGRLAEAEGHVGAMRESASAAGQLPLTQARALVEIAALRAAQGRHDEAADDARQALALLQAIQVPESPLSRRARALLDASTVAD